jgi:hypothetical protein
MTPIYLGPDKYRIWVHRGEQLEKCHILRMDYNVMKRLMDRMKRFGAKFERELRADDKRIFGAAKQSP